MSVSALAQYQVKMTGSIVDIDQSRDLNNSADRSREYWNLCKMVKSKYAEGHWYFPNLNDEKLQAVCIRTFSISAARK